MDRSYIYHESTTSICPECLTRIPAKIVFKEGQVRIKKICPTHGAQEELFEEDLEYHLKKRTFDKPGTISKTQTEIDKGCPFDCGLCPNHDQHTCIGLVEITKQCDLGCPTCYANSGQGEPLPVAKISQMLDFFVDSEGGEAEILQISGGEPTTHPDIIEIIKIARTKKIGYVMLNTNGIRIAEDEKFVKELSQFQGKFEVYLQFDGLKAQIYSKLRGRDLVETKLRAIENLAKYNIPITLVTTIAKGLNDDVLGDIIEFGLKTTCVRGINFQPVAYFGRLPKVDTKERVTLSGVIKRIEAQAPEIFQPGDIIPLPCNVERVAVTYLARGANKKFVPITRNIKVQNYLPLIDNTFFFDADKIIKNKTKQGVSPEGCCSCMSFLKDIKNLVPLNFALKSKAQKQKYINENTFRISVTSFVDVYNFDLKSMQKECVHIITPDLKKIPFSSYNMFYRK